MAADRKNKEEKIQAGEGPEAMQEETLAETGNGTEQAVATEETPGTTVTADNESDTGQLQQELEYLRQQVEEYTDKALRIQAEMDNLRKRTVRDIENAHKYALDKFIKELLPVIDSMELGIAASDGAYDIESLREGMDLTLKKFLDTLDKFGVAIIDPQGEKFNPEKHEAVSIQEGDNGASGTVLTVMQKGFELNGRLVRPAMVIVAK